MLFTTKLLIFLFVFLTIKAFFKVLPNQSINHALKHTKNHENSFSNRQNSKISLIIHYVCLLSPFGFFSNIPCIYNNQETYTFYMMPLCCQTLFLSKINRKKNTEYQ